ncbi:MAG TPA: sigma-70 family RNA polymerase sigma factor [Candidatus Microsaccharimonas sp.]|nr:sigma-70 family RNA polymerase sigma factor [Candidatus Microsaccharimonas sp.]
MSEQRVERGEPSVDQDLVGMYLKEIGREPLLDAEKEVELAKTIEAGMFAQHLLNQVDESESVAPDAPSTEELEWFAEQGREAKDQFMRANLRLVVSIARKYGRSQMPMLDLIQEGNTGLVRAVEKFDYTKGYKFSTYATWWVRQAITRGIAQQARIVRLPVHVVEDLNQVTSTRRTLERDLGREPEPAEIAAELGLETERVIDLLGWGRDHVSLDTPIDDDGETTIGDLHADEHIPSPETNVLEHERLDQLNALLHGLDARTRDIIESRSGVGDGRIQKLADIGKRWGISAERVRQVERLGMQQLIAWAESGEIPEPTLELRKPVSEEVPIVVPAEYALSKVTASEKRSGRKVIKTEEIKALSRLMFSGSFNPEAYGLVLGSQETRAVTAYLQLQNVALLSEEMGIVQNKARTFLHDGLKALKKAEAY